MVELKEGWPSTPGKGWCWRSDWDGPRPFLVDCDCVLIWASGKDSSSTARPTHFAMDTDEPPEPPKPLPPKPGLVWASTTYDMHRRWFMVYEKHASGYGGAVPHVSYLRVHHHPQNDPHAVQAVLDAGGREHKEDPQ